MPSKKSSASSARTLTGVDATASLPDLDWRQVARLLMTSREIDRIEEEELVPGGLVKYQFSARGHDLAQIMLSLQLNHPKDAAGVYYRSRPFVLAAGLTPEEAIAATMGRAGSPNGGRDIGVVFSMPRRVGATILPMSGDVGAQYTPALGWAHGIRYRADALGEAKTWDGAMAVALGGDGSCATPGFWSALNMATTGRLPYLFSIEDNGYAISVERRFQTPGEHIAANLASYAGLTILNGDGTDPAEAAILIAEAVRTIRSGEGPVMLRLEVPRLSGHSFQDNQAYKSEELRASELARDPLPKFKDFAVPEMFTSDEWDGMQAEVIDEVKAAAERAANQPHNTPESALRFVFTDAEQVQEVGGTRPEDAGLASDFNTEPAPPTPERKNLVDTVRMALEAEMKQTDRLLVFGEDVGAKGGVHGATMDMQLHFGEDRVFDTALTEEGIIGRAVGLAYTGLIPVPEIQFRKYADPATEQLNDCGTVRWRTDGRFAAPVIVRMPVGFSPATGDPWHSVSDESILAHSVGWKVVMPSDAEDAVGLLRTALRGDDPVYFLEHRALYFGADARKPYPGDDYMIPFGQAARRAEGDQLTLVTWGAMVHRSLEAAKRFDGSVDILDLRTIIPWDREAVLDSVTRTGRCLVVHEDHLTAGFGGEIAAVVSEEVFQHLDAPVTRIGGADCPVPYDLAMMDGVVPSVERIREAIEEILAF